ncbi:MAG TPA: S-adenosylmethionine:tRNA ribosyltransferase-isomerase [Streptosporangiaceae bacterium]|jgi:S-adenosylmethionine:tRNA ribosyltransferase-isomerase|nr:S-adenosylmethionine:tRNA ribosyltransferase-isomerase [Streptosporangiaceae bacterium]
MTSTVLAGFDLPAQREASAPPEARGTPRDEVALMVSRRATSEISHHRFSALPGMLLPGDLLVVNTSATIPAAVRCGRRLWVHFSTPLPDGAWLAELRSAAGRATVPYRGGSAGQVLTLPGSARLTLCERVTGRLWRARLSTAVLPYLRREGAPIRYSYVDRAWPLEAYQTVFAVIPGSAEMPSASRPFTAGMVARLVARGITIAPVTLHTGVSSLEGDEEPYPEPFEVPPATARLVGLTHRSGGRVIAAGTTVVRALESAASSNGQMRALAGWTSHVVTPATGLRAVHGLLTGLHEPRSSHLRMLAAFAGPDLLRSCYEAALERDYLWHEFGDVHLLLP